MIAFFNRMGNSWVAKGIFFLLGLSMLAFWGIGGISNTSTSDMTAIKVGSNKVSMQELGRTFDQERNKMAKISGGYMTPKRAIQAGLLDQVVQQLAMRELNTQIQDEIGLIASDESVRGYIEKNPIFTDNLGKFDANLFYAYLSGMNMSQAEFAAQLRKELAHQHLTRTLMHAVPRSPSLMKVAALSKKEKRRVVGVLLTPDKMTVGTPDVQELKDYYEAYMEEFSIPEYRTLRIVSFGSKDFKGENAYDQMYEKSRQLEDLLGAGKNLKEACAELKLNAGQVMTLDLSGKDKSGKDAPASAKLVLQEAFGLAEGEATSLIDVEGGFVVAGVEKITPRAYRDFNSVQGEVAKLWRAEKQKEALSKAVEEILASVKDGKGFGKYAPMTDVVSQTESGAFPKMTIPSLLQQDTGVENVSSLPTEKGVLVAYIQQVVPFKGVPTEAELQETVNDWNLDLQTAVQQAYMRHYPIDVHQGTIQKAFAIYDTEEE